MTALCSGKICTIFPEKGALNFWKACTIALEYSSSIQHDNHGISGIALSMPAIVGKDGIEGTVPISLNSREEEALQHSAETLENIIRENLLST